jgi:hypothetical protein
MTTQKPFMPYTSSPRYKGYTRRSVYVTMRDGIRLAVDIELPKGLPADEKIPAILQQTRYWRNSELKPPLSWFHLSANDLPSSIKKMKRFFIDRGYAVVTVDVRGTGASFGAWQYPWEDASVEDAREIVDWIIAQSWSNGCVGGLGISYMGTTAELLLALQHPAIKAVALMFNHPDASTDIAFPGGVFNARFMREWSRMNAILDQNKLPFLKGLARYLVRGVSPVDEDQNRHLLESAVAWHVDNFQLNSMEDITYRDESHPDRNLCLDSASVMRFREAILINPAAIYGWASWMDAGTADAAIRRFLTLPNARHLVIGAWSHGGFLQASPVRSSNTPVSPPFIDQWTELLRFFDAYLKDIANGAQEETTIYYYTLGAETWQQTRTWPPAGTHIERWFFGENRMLTSQPLDSKTSKDMYQVDYSASTGELNRWWELGVASNQSVRYPNRAAQDQKLICYTSPPVEQDIHLCGYPVIHLAVSSSESDVAFYVYLEVVTPDRQATYLTEGLLRGIHHKISNQPSPYKLQVPYHSFRQDDGESLIPGNPAEVEFGLLPVSALIRRGQRIRVAIAGHDEGNFPRHPQEGNAVYTFYRSNQHACWIDLPIQLTLLNSHNPVHS